MILEYLFLDKKSQPDIEDFNAKILNGKIKEGKLHIIYKEFDEADYWAVRYEYGKNSELDALYLSDLNEDIICKFSPTVLINESAEFFNKKLYPLINKFERLLRKFLFLRVTICDVKKFEHIIKEIESKDFGDIYNILFVDDDFCRDVRNKIKKSTSRFEMIQILENAEENTAWDILVSNGTLSLIKDNFDALKTYRNDVMHAHNIGENTYKKARRLFEEANLQLEQEINKMIEFSYSYQNSEEHTNTLYEKLLMASENIAKIDSKIIKTAEVLRNSFAHSLSLDELSGMQKTVELLADAFSKFQYYENESEKTDEEKSENDEDWKWFVVT